MGVATKCSYLLIDRRSGQADYFVFVVGPLLRSRLTGGPSVNERAGPILPSNEESSTP